MHPYFRDYVWQKGVPRGAGRLSAEEAAQAPFAYKIVDDPYRKRFSVERYCGPVFEQVIYDSQLLDFRRLKPAEQQGWLREIVRQTSSETRCLIRNQEERLLYAELLTFEGSYCRECLLSTPQGTLLSIHRLFYTGLGDAFNGIRLYDINDHLVLEKRYAVGPSGEFTQLLEERWDHH